MRFLLDAEQIMLIYLTAMVGMKIVQYGYKEAFILSVYILYKSDLITRKKKSVGELKLN